MIEGQMKSQKFVRFLMMVVVLFTATILSAEQFPAGGYQGGNHGNVKVKTWSGAADEKWNVAANWCPAGVPGGQDDVVIPVTATTPEVKVPGMSCKNLVIRAGATLIITPGYTLNVNGHVAIEK
jgi:hypothetical protein